MPSFVYPPPSWCISVMNYSLLPSLHNETLFCLCLASASGSWHFSHCSSCSGVSALTPKVETSPLPQCQNSTLPPRPLPTSMRGPQKFRLAMVPWKPWDFFLSQGCRNKLMSWELLLESWQPGVNLWTCSLFPKHLLGTRCMLGTVLSTSHGFSSPHNSPVSCERNCRVCR